ncbi:MAG: GntR family transcriptional regulator [Victivallales bacterium]
MNAYRNKKEKFKESLLFQIASGNLKVGDRIPPERSLCELNKLSRITIRNALAELEREKIIEKRGRKGVFICGIPEISGTHEIHSDKVVKNKPRKILYVFFSSQPDGLDVNTAAFSSIFRGINKFVNMKKDIAMLFEGESFLRNSEKEKKAYDGFIVGGVSLEAHLPEIIKLNIPTVVAASFACGMDVDSVSIDFYEGGYVAAKKLKKEGCENLLFLGIEYKHDNFTLQPIMQEKYRGISNCCLMNNMSEPVLFNIFNQGSGPPLLDKSAKRKLLGIIKNKKIDGIICCGSELHHVIDCLNSEIIKKKYPLPRLAIFNDGTGNMSGKEYIQIVKDVELCGFRAAEMLYERFQNPNADRMKKLILVKLPA